MDWFNIMVIEDRLMYGLQVCFLLLGSYLYDQQTLACSLLFASCGLYLLILYLDHRGNMKAQRELNERLPNYRETMSTEEVLKKMLEDPELMEMTLETTVDAMWLATYKRYVVYFQLVLVLVASFDV